MTLMFPITDIGPTSLVDLGDSDPIIQWVPADICNHELNFEVRDINLKKG